MPAVVIFFETWEDAASGQRRRMPVDNTTEMHVFESDLDAMKFSQANIRRPHTIRAIDPERWHVGTPSPAPPLETGQGPE